MEYNLLKTIETNLGANLVPNEQYPRLSSFPATDFVNPGVGQICRLYSFYVPMYSRQNLHEKQKKIELENLEGSGVTESNEALELNETENETSKDPIEFNLEKRKRLGEAIQESFQHPKLIKTDKIIFKKPQKTQKSEAKLQETSANNFPQKVIKHKFKLLD